MKVKTLFLFILLLTGVCASYARDAAKADTSMLKNEPVPEKYQNAAPRIPALSFVLSAITPLGLGQYYNKQYGKGAIITGMEVGSIIGFASTFHISFGGSGSDSGTSAVFALVFIGTYLYSVIDAPVAANNINDKYHLGGKKSFTTLHLSPTVITGGGSYANNNSTIAGFKLTLR